MKCYCDRFIYISLLIANILLYFTFSEGLNFWVMMSISMLTLLIIALIKEKPKFELKIIDILKYSISTGIGLYLLFRIGKEIIVLLQLPLLADLYSLYAKVQITEAWHYIVLFLIIIPGEELFWRGYIQKRLTTYFTPKKGIIYSTLLYAFANIYSDSILLLVAGIFGGLLWGSLYHYTKNIWLSIISHMIFNLLLLVLFPII